MSRLRQTLVDLLSMSRFANLPTVWSNVVLGWLVGQSFGFGRGNVRLPMRWRNDPSTTLFDYSNHQFEGLGFLVCLSVAASFLYLGGCFLNDWKDRDFDRENRPERAISAGRFSASFVLFLAISFLAIGVGLAFWASGAAFVLGLLITFCILIYTWWHKTKTFSLLFMAGSRAGLYFLGAFGGVSLATLVDHFSFGWVRASYHDERLIGGGASLFEGNYPLLFSTYALSPSTWVVPLLALGLGCYILGISLFARFESRKPDATVRPPCWIIALFLAPLITHPGLFKGLWVPWLPPAILPYSAAFFWIAKGYRKNLDVGQFVSRTLGCIPLVDLILATLIVFAAGEFLIPEALGRPFFYLFFPACCVLAFFLQKLAPAT